MKFFNLRSLLITSVAAAVMFVAAPVLAEDDDTYVSPSSGDGSDEQLREEGESGFDTPGSLYIPEDDYAAGDQGDGTWSPANVPPASEPVPVDAGEENPDEGDDGS